MTPPATPQKKSWLGLGLILTFALVVALVLLWANQHPGSKFAELQRYLDKNVKGGERSQAYFYIDDCIAPMLERYHQDMGEYPNTQEGILALFQAPPGKAEKWHGPYIETEDKELPKDPWGSPYQYLSPGKYHPQSYDLWSIGPDKKSGTADDLGNW